MVIFKTSAEGPEPGEIEFNVEEEHGKILVARREQEVMYEEDAMEGWELAREIAARHDHDSEDDDMKID